MQRLSSLRTLAGHAPLLRVLHRQRQPTRGVLTSVVNPLENLDDDQREVAVLARRFADDNLAPAMREWDENHVFPTAVLRKSAELGFGAIYCSEEFGGTGMGRLEASLIFEGLATGCVSTTAYISIHNMCAWMIDTYGTPAQRDKWIPKLASMDCLASYCLTEPGAGSDAANLATTARRDGNELVLNGSKAFISGAGESDIYLVMVRTGGAGSKGISCVLVEKGTEGLSFGKNEMKIGWRSQPTRVVTFEDCRIPVENIIGSEGRGFNIAMAGLNGGRVNIASCSLGGAQAALENAVAHVKVRKQFGAPLSDLQSVQFKLSELAMKVVSSRLMVRQAANMLQEKHPAASSYCAMAKAHATEACYKVCDEAIQLHGGYGYLNDYPVGQYWRDLRVHRILEGTNEIMRSIIAKEILKD